jgi:putative transposase
VKGEFEMSERRACRVMNVHRATFRYELKAKGSKALLQKVREVANKHPSYGYRRIHNRLGRLGFSMSLNKFRRIYAQEKLKARRRRNPRRIHGQGGYLPPVQAKKPLDLWAMDFMYETTMTGRRMRLLTIIDHHSRYCPGIFVKSGFSALDLCKVLDHLIEIEGKPNAIISDNGTEFTAHEFKAWAERKGIQLFYIRPGRPVENGMIESFNGRVRDECLNPSDFTSLEDAGDQLEKWRVHYNEERPHSSLGYVSPSEFMKQSKLDNGLE